MSSLVTSTAPLAPDAEFSSGPLQIARAISITGTVSSDQDGTLYIDQGGDGQNWDFTTAFDLEGGSVIDVDMPLLTQWFQVRFDNGSAQQTFLRLYIDARDPYGAFLQPALAPSAGGAWAVLQYNPASGQYSYVGRFDAPDGFAACGYAALATGNQAKYAAALVTSFTVADETIIKTTEFSPDSF